MGDYKRYIVHFIFENGIKANFHSFVNFYKDYINSVRIGFNIFMFVIFLN
ncbi:hypothetical protein THERMOT_461 [Bathymodiolus thermophilus thioautotrophic gill symbiont]|nr:hypothetical protein THERMOT_461 [Bathymodiolus thermophilus thioautotrophic gill symbiont]